MSDFRTPMRELHNAHRNFQNEWRRWRNGELKKEERKRLNPYEPESVTLARNAMLTALGKLFDSEIYPLELELRANSQFAADKIIEFLSIDILAFRCGYAKEFFLTKLKSVQLTGEQIKSLRQIALEMCEVYNFHREFRRWCHLMIKLADREFVEKLTQLSKSTNRYAAIKSKWMLETIFHHRKDLAQNY
jgi:hypothetical protein